VVVLGLAGRLECLLRELLLVLLLLLEVLFILLHRRTAPILLLRDVVRLAFDGAGGVHLILLLTRIRRRRVEHLQVDHLLLLLTLLFALVDLVLRVLGMVFVLEFDVVRHVRH